MATETTTNANVPTLRTANINGRTFQFAEHVMTRGTGKGRLYWTLSYPDNKTFPDPAQFQQILGTWGQESLLKAFQKTLDDITKAASAESITEQRQPDGTSLKTIDAGLFQSNLLKIVAELTARAAVLAQLNEELAKARAEQNGAMEIVLKKFSANERPSAGETNRVQQAMMKVAELERRIAERSGKAKSKAKNAAAPKPAPVAAPVTA